MQQSEHTAVHEAHCNQGEYVGRCKYSDDDCPVMAMQQPEQPSVEQGQWQKRKTLIADWDFWQIWDGPRPVADFLLEPDADRIIADHTTAALVPGLLAVLRKAAEGDAHSEALAEDRHCPACRASLDFEKHEGDCYLAAIIAQAEAAQQGETA